MRFNTLNEWLSWQETLHPTEIELGLERVGEVLSRLNLNQPNFTLVTVAGTNGKGSSVSMLEAILLAAGYRVGSYTSPHLLHYNERIKLDGKPVDDATLCASFARIDAARDSGLQNDGPQKISLSYFEFGTLAAIDILHRAELDIAILEVGLGGRLDAVNVLDADVALITALDVDHPDWLGADRETIAREKAGIMRAERPAVCADPDPPASLLAVAESLEVPLSVLGEDFHIRQAGECWSWLGPQCQFKDLPLPALPGDFQLNNAAGVLAVLSALAVEFPVNTTAIAQGLQAVQLPGRYQRLPGAQGSPLQILDVAHNAQSAQALADNLAREVCPGRTVAVLGMLADKDITTVLAHLGARIDGWYLAPLPTPRSASVAQLQSALAKLDLDATIETFDDVAAAYQAALAASTEKDRIVVTGSFYTVAAVLGEAV